jgi:hypothetical protein
MAAPTLLCLLIALAAWWWPRPPAAHLSLGPAKATAAAPERATAPPPRAFRPRSERAATPTTAAGEAPQDPALVACANSLTAALQARGRQLAKSADGHDLAVSAQLLWIDPTSAPLPRQRQLLEQALARVPDDPAIAWTYLRTCFGPQCDARAALDRVLRLDPDNAAAWLVAADQALERQGTGEAERLLHRAAAAPRVDAYWGRTVRAVFERVGAMPKPARCTGQMLTSMVGTAARPGTMEDVVAVNASVVGHQQLPFFKSLYSLCPTSDHIPRHRLPDCRAVYARLADSPELVFQSHGIAASQALAATRAEKAYWRERWRELRWATAQMGTQWTPAHQRLALEYGEVPALIGTLDAAELWPPPPDWQPPVDR